MTDPEYVLPRHPDVPGRDRPLPEWPPLTPAEEAAVRAMAAVPDGKLRERLTQALTREHYRRARERIEASPEEHCAALADAVLPIAQAERRRALADLDAGRVTAEAGAARMSAPAGDLPEEIDRLILRWHNDRATVCDDGCTCGLRSGGGRDDAVAVLGEILDAFHLSYTDPGREFIGAMIRGVVAPDDYRRWRRVHRAAEAGRPPDTEPEEIPGEERGAPVDWEATARQRERELKRVGEARHQADATVARIRAFAASLQDPGAPLFWPTMGRRIELELDPPRDEEADHG